MGFHDDHENLDAQYKDLQKAYQELGQKLDTYESDTEIQKYVTAKSTTGSMGAKTSIAASIEALNPNAMDTEEDAVGELATTSSTGLTKPTVKRTDILKNTKALRTAAKNLMQKLARLRVRLVKYSEAVTTNQRKKYYQFRFVSPDNSEIHMYDDNRKKADEKVAAVVIETLTKDVNEQINAAKQALVKIPDILRKEIDEARLAALAVPDLSNDETTQLEKLWDDLLQSNTRWLEYEIAKIKGASVPKVCKGNSDLSAFLTALLETVIVKLTVIYLNPNVGAAETTVTPTKISWTPNQENSDAQPEKTQAGPAEAGSSKQKQKVQEGQQGTTKIGKEGKQTGSKKQKVGKKSSKAAAAAAEKEGQQEKQAQQQKGQQKVFVNVATQRQISIPSYVFNMLNLGANYQLISFPSFQQRKQAWKEVRLPIRKMILDSESFNVNNKNSYRNIMDAVQSVMICDNNYFNKTVAQSKRFKQAVKNNKLVKEVFNFLESNELMCILADKNLGLTIIDKSWYIEHMLKHFERSEVFDFVGELQHFDVVSLHFQPWLQTQAGKFLSNKKAIEFASEFVDNNARLVPQAYGLIKLHKTPYKLRYITPVVEWINVKAAREVASRLSLYVKYFEHILTNSSELVREMEGRLSYSYVLMSYDVSDMYNSIGQQDVLTRLPVIAKNYGWWDAKNDKWWNETMLLISFVFETSYVGFGGLVYKQKRGLPMGSPLSPVLANLYMAELEDKTKDLSYKKGFTYYRYLDDILMIHSMNASQYLAGTWTSQRIKKLAHDFITQLVVESDGSINFDETGSASKVGEYVEYLDLKVKIGEMEIEGRNRVIRFEVFDKPTNLHIYTDPSTFYPFNYVYNWVQGENIRLIRNSSTQSDYAKSLDDFKRFLIRRKYSLEIIDRFVQLNYFEDRDELLRHEKPHKDRLVRKPDGNTRYVAVQNSGTRPLVTKAVNTINNLCHTLEVTDITIKPVITQGITVVSVMNKAKKNLQTQKFDDSSL
jgi:hypothetical protein